MSQLSIKIAQCRHASLEAFDDAWFEFLKDQGCTGFYLQNSPFDPERTGNRAQFFHHFHLISLYDLGRSHRRAEYQDYVNEICKRANGHGLEVWLDCWEPRLPLYAQQALPSAWRGQGGWGWHGCKDIAFCWEHPEGVAYWKAMARDALRSVPGLAGVILSMVDNEASFCDESCPRCEGRSVEAGVHDILTTFKQIGSERPKGLRLALYDWWLPEHLVEDFMASLPPESLVIGRSARGIATGSPDGTWQGHVSDISNVVDGVGDDFAARCAKVRERGHVPIDMIAWSRGMENFFLPAPPDPHFAIRKSRAVADAGGSGWMDYDCGCLEPGSLAEALKENSQNHSASENEIVARVLQTIWGSDAAAVQPAYELYREARRWTPCGLTSRIAGNFDGRLCGLGFCLFSPFLITDLGFCDTVHAKNYFAPFNLFVEDTIGPLLISARETRSRLEVADGIVREQEASTPAAAWEKAVFEIYWRSFRALENYARLADAKWNHQAGRLDAEGFRQLVGQIAGDELDNLAGAEAWHARQPGQLGNPCHRLVGHMCECWPEADFRRGLFDPKRRSLEFLANSFKPGEIIPPHVVLGTADDGILI